MENALTTDLPRIGPALNYLAKESKFTSTDRLGTPTHAWVFRPYPV